MRKVFALAVAFTLAFLGSSSTATAQWTFRFKPIIGGKEIFPDSCYLLSNTNKTVCISTLKFYISGMALKNEKNKIIREKKSFHLINIQDTNSLTISPQLSTNFQASSLQFFLGIDSITNSAGVQGGCLDPMQGMYWTWLSGYINLKLEGHYPSDSTSFQYHLGGYRAPFNALQTVVIEIPDVKYLEIPIDIEKIFSHTDASFPAHIMSPGKEAMQLSKLTATMFPSSVK